MGFKPRISSEDDIASAIIGLVIGSIFIGLGFWVRHIEADERDNFLKTDGKVVDITVRTVQERDKDFLKPDKITKITAPVIEFVTTTGETIRFTGGSDWASSASKGTILPVKYNPKNAQNTVKIGNWMDGFYSWVVFGLGSASILPCLGFLPIYWHSEP
jgi:hypothetical protein